MKGKKALKPWEHSQPCLTLSATLGSPACPGPGPHISPPGCQPLPQQPSSPPQPCPPWPCVPPSPAHVPACPTPRDVPPACGSSLGWWDEPSLVSGWIIKSPSEGDCFHHFPHGCEKICHPSSTEVFETNGGFGQVLQDNLKFKNWAAVLLLPLPPVFPSVFLSLWTPCPLDHICPLVKTKLKSLSLLDLFFLHGNRIAL